ncbi:MAG: hypothetical protein ACI9MC_001754 [Kiritimatiellia bacterium]
MVLRGDTIEKLPEITHMLQALRVEERGWRVVDYWDADQAAVGVARLHEPNWLVYVSIDDRKGFWYDCEDAPGRSVKCGEAGDLVSLEAVLVEHLSAGP